MYNNQYFQLDIYKEPCHPRCRGLMLLETYTTLSKEEFKDRLPKFLNVDQEVIFSIRNWNRKFNNVLFSR